METQRLLTVKEIAKYLSVHEITVYRLLKDKKIPALRIGGQWRFDIDSVRTCPYIREGGPASYSAAKSGGLNKTIPKSLWKYFWDAAPQKVYLDRNRDYVLERLLEYGDMKAAKWLKKNFSAGDIEDILAKSRRISPMSANYWRLILRLKRPYDA